MSASDHQLATIHLDVDSGSFQALAAGPADGPLVVVAHGFPDHPPSFAALVTELAGRGLRVVAPWLRGYAPSTLAGPYDPDTLAADLLAMAAAVAPGRRFHLVGHDWGAVITYAAAARAPDRLASATALSVPHPLVFLRALTRSAQLLRSWYMLLFQLPGAERVAAARDFALIDRLWRTWSPGLDLEPAQRDQLHRCLRASWPAPLLYYRALVRPPGAALARARDPAARRIAVPLQYLHGGDDGCIAPQVVSRAADHARRLFTGPYRAEVVADAGHFLPVERPTLVAARVADWVAAHPA